MNSTNLEARLLVDNPKDGSLVADDVALAGESDVDTAVLAAEKAFPLWRDTPPNKRRDTILKFASLMLEHSVALAELTRITLGAPVSAGKFEVIRAVEVFEYFAGWIDKFAGESFPQEDGFLKLVRNEPLGVTAGIVPWNGPIALMSFKAAPALATGNCFILKPSEKTPFAAAALGALIKEAGFPPGVFQVLTGDGSTGALLAAHMKVRKISFTGSVTTGKRIQVAAANSNLKRVTLELGGKSPAVIFDDCNLENAVSWTAENLARNSGQVCFAPTRLYVQEGIYDKFIEGYKSSLKNVSVGDPELETTKMGPLVDQLQFQRVTGFIDRGQNGQGSLLLGGKRVGEKVTDPNRLPLRSYRLTPSLGLFYRTHNIQERGP
jgi:aldehyde dehydrogenase (NAD+)